MDNPNKKSLNKPSVMLDVGLAIGTTGYFQQKLGKQALILINFLLKEGNAVSVDTLYEKFIHKREFASGSTVRFELDRLAEKNIISPTLLETERKIQLTKEFVTLIKTFDIDIPEILDSYFDDTFIKCSPIFEDRGFRENHSAFVIMPNANQFSGIFTEIIKPAVQSIEYMRCIRSDEIFSDKPSIERIWWNVVSSKVVIADLTSKDANVFYQAGIAHTLGKPTILIAQSIEDVPLDLRHLTVIIYEATSPGYLKLQDDLLNAIEALFFK